MKRINSISKTDKKNNFLKFLIVLLFFAILSLVISIFFNRHSNAMKETISSSKIYSGLNLKTSKQETDAYTLFISQPTSNEEKINQPINDWVNQEKEAFKKDVQNNESTLKKNNFIAHLNIQTETSKLADKLYNLELESYQFTGGANGFTKTETFLLDLEKKRFLEIKDIFSSDEDSLNSIRELFFEELEKEDTINEFIFDDLLEEKITDEENWKLSVQLESIDFIFDQYEIAVGAAGNIRVSIPMDKMIPYLNPNFAKNINVELPEKEKMVKESVESNKSLSQNKEKLKAGGKYIALTFDDGPHQEVTPRILEILEEHQAKATFYMLGKQVEYYPFIAREVLEMGHELGSHTMSHKDLTLLGPDQIQEEIQSTSLEIEKATGDLPHSLRPPYGAFNDTVKDIVSRSNLPMIMWSVDSLDWKSRDVNAINQEVMTNVHPGAIVLLHDIHSTTADALPQLLTNLENENYEFVTVSQLLEFSEYEGIGPHYNVKIE